MMSTMAGNIMHTDWQGMRWNVPLLGVVIGGALWALFAGVLGWLIASICPLSTGTIFADIYCHINLN